MSYSVLKLFITVRVMNRDKEITLIRFDRLIRKMFKSIAVKLKIVSILTRISDTCFTEDKRVMLQIILVPKYTTRYSSCRMPIPLHFKLKMLTDFYNGERSASY